MVMVIVTGWKCGIFLLSYTSNNSHDKSGLFTNHFQFRNNSLVSKREVCRKVKVKHRN